MDEKFGVFDLLFLRQVTEEHFPRYNRSGRLGPNVKDYVGFRFNRCVEPDPFPSTLTTVSTSAILLESRPAAGSSSGFCTRLWMVDLTREAPNNPANRNNIGAR
jgi:hypothetical protein